MVTVSLLLGGCGSTPERPDIILVTLDTTRADRLGCYGYELASTPYLDEFAASAIQFDNAVTAVPITSPSHATMLTGKTPLRHGVHNNGTFYLDPAQMTLTEHLAGEGYQTAAFLSAYVLHRQFGLAQGFDVYDDDLIDERLATETNARVFAYLQRLEDRPLFLWVHYFDPHTPWDPPEPFASQTRGTVYDAEISSMDAAFGELMEKLRAAGRFENAHVLVLGDHGEGLGDHGEREHGLFLYEETLRIPFLWKPPHHDESKRSDELVGTVDLLPTVLDLLDREPPGPDEFDGFSLAPILHDEALPMRTGLYAETLFPYYNFEWSPLFAYRSARAKYIDAPRPEFYDLQTDPGERTNLLAIPEGIAATRDAATRGAATGGATDQDPSSPSAATRDAATRDAATRDAIAQDVPTGPGVPELAARLAKRLRNERLRYGQSDEVPQEGGVSPEVEERLRSLGYVWTAGHEEKADLDSLPDPKDLIDIHAEYERAKEAMDESRYPEAITSFETVLARMPRNATATLGLGIALEEVGRAREALVYLDRHLDIKPSNTVAHQRRGDALYQLGRYREALDAYEAAAGNEGAFLALARKRGLTLAHLGRFEDALTAFREGKARMPAERQSIWERWETAARALADLGVEQLAEEEESFSSQVRATMLLDMSDVADRLLERGAGRFPAAAALLRAEVAQMEGDWPAMERHLQRAIDHGRDDEAIYLAMVLSHLQQDDSAAAERTAQDGIQSTNDEGGRLHYNLACLRARRGAISSALDALEEALARGHRRPDLLSQDPDLNALRDDPRFEALRQRVVENPRQ